MDQILDLLKQNNVLLKQILQILIKELNEDFMGNIVANIVADKIMRR